MQTSNADPFIIVEGGLVQNEPSLPIIDLDVLHQDRFDEDSAEEALDNIKTFLQVNKVTNYDVLQTYSDTISDLVDLVYHHGSNETRDELNNLNLQQLQ